MTPIALEALSQFQQKCSLLLPALSPDGFYGLVAEGLQLVPDVSLSDLAGEIGVTLTTVTRWKERRGCADTGELRCIAIQALSRSLIKVAAAEPFDWSQCPLATRENLVKLGIVPPGEVLPFPSKR